MAMLNDLVERITADEAIAAMTAQAFHVQPDEDDYRRAVEAVRALCRDADGNDLPGDSELPVGEFQAALTEALGNQRVIVHCVMSLTSADWDLDEAVALLREADEIGWCPPFWGGHNLAVVAASKHYNFQVSKPDEASR